MDLLLSKAIYQILASNNPDRLIQVEAKSSLGWDIQIWHWTPIPRKKITWRRKGSLPLMTPLQYNVILEQRKEFVVDHSLLNQLIQDTMGWTFNLNRIVMHKLHNPVRDPYIMIKFVMMMLSQYSYRHTMNVIKRYIPSDVQCSITLHGQHPITRNERGGQVQRLNTLIIARRARDRKYSEIIVRDTRSNREFGSYCIFIRYEVGKSIRVT